MTETFIIGIDPGRKTGVGVIRAADGVFLGSYTKDFFSSQIFLNESFKNRSEVLVVIEVSPAVRLPETGFDPQTRDKILVNTGGVKREAELLAESIRRIGFKTVEVPPIRGGKWTEEEFQLATGSNLTANEHERDAVRLAMNFRKKQ